MLAEPSLNQQIKAYVGGVNGHIQHMQNRCQAALHTVRSLIQTCILHVIQCKTQFSQSSRKLAPTFFESHGEGRRETQIVLHHSAAMDDNWKPAEMLLQSRAPVYHVASQLTTILFQVVNYIENILNCQRV